jgi:hypothetical protein
MGMEIVVQLLIGTQVNVDQLLDLYISSFGIMGHLDDK